jgi:hypothetical protein
MKKNEKITNLAKLFTNKPNLLINDLNSFYVKFKNRDKIIKLLIIWLSQYNFFCTTYIKLQDFKRIVSIKKSILQSAINISNHKFEIIPPKKNIIFNFISLIVASFLKQFFLRGYRLEKKSFYLGFLSFISHFFFSLFTF